MQYHIKIECWEATYEYLEQEKGLHTKDKEGLKIFYEALWYMNLTGIQWSFFTFLL